MLTTCPKCRQTYVGKSCPRCAPQTLRSSAHRSGAPWDNPLTPGHWSQNPWVRCAVGVAVSQGLFLGLRRWAEAAVCFFGPQDTYLAWSGYEGFAAWGLLQAVCVLVGSMLVGSGQREWMFYGLAVGFINTIIDLALSGSRFIDITPTLIIVLMLGSFFAGVLGSRLGALIWRPLESSRTTLEVASGGARGGIAVKDLFAGINFLSLKVNWLRIAIGAAVGIAGPPFAGWIFFYLVGALGMRSWLEDNQQVQTGVFIILIRILSVFLAGFLAGTNSANGPAQGFWTGLLCAGGMVVVRYLSSQSPTGEPFVVQEIIAYAFIALALCIVGAIFGARLLPPVIHRGKKRKLTKVAEI